jgi:hypothetical protein
MKESGIQKQILDYLLLKGIFHYRNNSGAFIDSKQHFYRRGWLAQSRALRFTSLLGRPTFLSMPIYGRHFIHPEHRRRVSPANCSLSPAAPTGA